MYKLLLYVKSYALYFNGAVWKNQIKHTSKLGFKTQKQPDNPKQNL